MDARQKIARLKNYGFFIRYTHIIAPAIGVLLGTCHLASARVAYQGSESDSTAHEKSAADFRYQFEVHNIGKLSLAVTNFGTIGIGYLPSAILEGERFLGSEYPINSDIEYLGAGAIWIGGIVGRDTLVSVSADGFFRTREIIPAELPEGAIVRRSSIRSRLDFSDQAVSEQDFICHLTDTATAEASYDPFDNRPHIPLNLDITQSSYAWSFGYAEDFIIFDYKIVNVGRHSIRNGYFGLFFDGDIYHRSRIITGYTDDLCGFRRTVPLADPVCIDEDTVNIAWFADNDGDPASLTSWGYFSPRAAMGLRMLRAPDPNLNYTFNWWISSSDPSRDFGPRLAGTATDPYRAFGAHRGTPTGDLNKYYVMSHPEVDYDQLFTAIPHASQGFEPPPGFDYAELIADGYDTRFMLSVGPFELDPGDTLPLAFAYIAGDNFHVNPRDFEEHYDPLNPSRFYERFSFADLGTNARWADWVYDNPGFDTDRDGDSGIYFCWHYRWSDTTDANPADSFLVDSFKVFYRGDGVPDYRGASAPPPPRIRIVPGFGKMTIRWNGQESENAVDAFSAYKDFEGYRIYFGEGDQSSDFVRLASYDLYDFWIYEFSPELRRWIRNDYPLTLEAIRALCGPEVDPSLYDSETNSYRDPFTGRYYYFRRQDWNRSTLDDPLGVRKAYPEADRFNPADTTDEGFHRFYEYEFEITNLEPSKPYYFSVTAFDFGSVAFDQSELESSVLVNMVREYPLPSAEMVEAQGLGVMVFPNPYRIDAGYADIGYENRERTKSAERARAIHFANLPHECTIRVYTADGDLVQEIPHSASKGEPGGQMETWNIISRNTQAVVTGVYIWHVQSAMGDQIGKLVIIK